MRNVTAGSGGSGGSWVRTTATVICERNHFQVVIDGETAAVVPRTTTSEIHRYKADTTDKRLLARPAEI